jgi:transcriptional regulator with XRE-family HTH domain
MLYLHLIQGIMDLNKLKEIRRSRKIKIQELSKITGISRNLISRIENGEGNPSFQNVIKLAEGLGLKIEIIATNWRIVSQDFQNLCVKSN